MVFFGPQVGSAFLPKEPLAGRKLVVFSEPDVLANGTERRRRLRDVSCPETSSILLVPGIDKFVSLSPGRIRCLLSIVPR